MVPGNNYSDRFAKEETSVLSSEAQSKAFCSAHEVPSLCSGSANTGRLSGDGFFQLDFQAAVVKRNLTSVKYRYATPLYGATS